MARIGIANLLVCILLLPQVASAYVIPHPQEREGRRNPRIEIVRDLRGEPIRSSRGTLLQRYRTDVPDDRLKKPSRRNISQLQKARMTRTRTDQDEELTQTIEQGTVPPWKKVTKPRSEARTLRTVDTLPRKRVDLPKTGRARLERGIRALTPPTSPTPTVRGEEVRETPRPSRR